MRNNIILAVAVALVLVALFVSKQDTVRAETIEAFNDGTRVEMVLSHGVLVFQIKQQDGKICYATVQGNSSAGSAITCVNTK